MTAVLSADPRPPVIYLRAFNRESEVFAELTRRELEAYSTYTEGRIGATFEEYFARAVTEAIGPFVALGSPEDYASPEGAARIYAQDKDWMAHFEELSRRAACILMSVDQSDNLRWELQSLKADALHEKLYVLTHPRETRGRRHLLIGLSRMYLAWRAKQQGLVPVSWSQFVAMLRPLGYVLNERDPGLGAVIAFDRAGHGEILCTDATTPGDYVKAIRQRLDPGEQERSFPSWPPGAAKACANTQDNLGNTLQQQGIRAGGEQGRELLTQAVEAFRSALEVRTREDLPQDWAMTQVNLGNALSEQGIRTRGEQARELLSQAVEAYRSALEIYTREDLPQQWAMTQNNLGNTLSTVA